MGESLSNVAMSVSLTSYSSIAAFIAGTFVDIPAIKVFCFYAAISFTANHILQFFIFLPCLTFSQKRISQKRNCCCFCYKHKEYKNI